MSARCKVKVKKSMPKGSLEDSDLLNDMFSQMTGADNADPEIIIPKVCELNVMISKYVKIYKMLLNFKEFIDNFPEYNAEFLEIGEFIKTVESLSDNNDEITEASLKNNTIKNVNLLYKKLKNTKAVQTIVIVSSNLSKYKKYLSDKNNLGDEFIKREPGLSLKPLSFTNLDLKVLWASDRLNSIAKKYILNILSQTYTIGHRVYQIITSPDIDIKKFSSVLINNIEKMKKQIPRCNKAFDIIANSVNMLESNFDGYYKTSVEAENPSIIIESFIIDVSMSQKANASTTSQFRKIIMFMKRQTSNNKDPRVSKLFKLLNSQFDLMQKETGTDSKFDEEDEDEENKDPQKETQKDPQKETQKDPQKETQKEDIPDENIDINDVESLMKDMMKTTSSNDNEYDLSEESNNVPDNASDEASDDTADDASDEDSDAHIPELD